MKRVVIIGGGITGLAAAHEIAERTRESGKQVDLTLLEAGPRLGGIIQTRERDGFLLEAGPDSFISEKPEALQLTKQLGLESQLIETNAQHRRSFVVRQGRLQPVPAGFHLLAPSRFWPFVSSEIFSWSGKARMALDLLLPRRKLESNSASAAAGEFDETLAHFVRRRFGREALERMAQPMVGGIYTADPEQLSLRATMPRFLEMERQHRSLIRALRQQNSDPAVGESAQSNTSGARYSLFLSFAQGMQVLTDMLAERIAAQFPDGIRLNTPIESLDLDRKRGKESQWKLKTNNGEILVADALCLALPAYVSASLLHRIEGKLARELASIPYASSVTINLAYKRADVPHPLDGFGFVVPFIEKRTLMAGTFSSVKFSGRAPEGHVLLRGFVGGALQPELFDLAESELLSRVRADLQALLGIECAPLFAEVAKWRRSMPQYQLGHLEKVRRIKERVASLPGLSLAGNAYGGLGISDCIRSGQTAANDLVAAM